MLGVVGREGINSEGVEERNEMFYCSIRNYFDLGEFVSDVKRLLSFSLQSKPDRSKELAKLFNSVT